MSFPRLALLSAVISLFLPVVVLAASCSTTPLQCPAGQTQLYGPEAGCSTGSFYYSCATSTPSQTKSAQAVAPTTVPQTTPTPDTATTPSFTVSEADQIAALKTLILRLTQTLATLIAEKSAAVSGTTATSAVSSGTVTTQTAAPTLTRNLTLGTKGDDVSALQQFLTQTGDYTYPEVTGYYGPVTQAAVERYQARNNIISSGSPSTTGYGSVGPKTRAALVAHLLPQEHEQGQGPVTIAPGGGSTPPPPGTTTTITPTPTGGGGGSAGTGGGGGALSPQACAWNGAAVADGHSVTAYQAATVPYGQSCTPETRTCQNGTFSGSYEHASCMVSPAASCTFNGQTIENGANVTAYQATSVAYGSACTNETRTCTNGTLSGSHEYASCVVGTASSCTWNGQSVANGSAVTAYQAATVPYGSACTKETRMCTNGSLSGSYQYGACTVQAAASCAFNGQTVANGSNVTAYLSSSVAYGSICTNQQRTCQNGALSGSYTNASCIVSSSNTFSLPSTKTLSSSQVGAWTMSVANVTFDPSVPQFYSPDIMFDGGVYKMWTTAGDRVRYFTSADGTRWTGGQTVFTAFPDSWEIDGGNFEGYPGGISDPRVVKGVTPGWEYTMYYTGGPLPNTSTHGGLGIAFSNDGVNWTRWTSNPFYRFLGGNSLAGRVITIDDTRYMYFVAGGSYQNGAIQTPPDRHIMKDLGNGYTFSADKTLPFSPNWGILFYDPSTRSCWSEETHYTSGVNSGPTSIDIYAGGDCFTTMGTKVAIISSTQTGNTSNFGAYAKEVAPDGSWLGGSTVQLLFSTGNQWGNWQPASVMLTKQSAPTPAPTPAPTAALTQTSATTVADGGAGQAFSISWSSTNATACTVQKTNPAGTLMNPWATGTSGTKDASSPMVGVHHWWIDCTGPSGTVHQDLYHTVVTGTISATPNPCLLSSSSSTCTMHVSWSTSNAPDATVYVHHIGLTDNLAVDHEPNNSDLSVTWVTEAGYVLDLHQTRDPSSPVLASITVKGFVSQ